MCSRRWIIKSTIGFEPPGCMVEYTILLVESGHINFVRGHTSCGFVRALVDQRDQIYCPQQACFVPWRLSMIALRLSYLTRRAVSLAPNMQHLSVGASLHFKVTDLHTFWCRFSGFKSVKLLHSLFTSTLTLKIYPAPNLLGFECGVEPATLKYWWEIEQKIKLMNGFSILAYTTNNKDKYLIDPFLFDA
jgi:hypothetical protein